jgi:X-Pro dipeptidyl-peptidase
MPEHSVRIYAALKQKGVPCMAYFHQGGHGGPPPLELDQPLVHALPLRHRERRREGRAAELDRARGRGARRSRRPTPTTPTRTRRRSCSTSAGAARRSARSREARARASKARRRSSTTPRSRARNSRAQNRVEHRLLYATEADQPVHLSGHGAAHDPARVRSPGRQPVASGSSRCRGPAGASPTT